MAFLDYFEEHPLVAGDTTVTVYPPTGENWVFRSIGTWGDGTYAGYANIRDATVSPNTVILHPGYNIGQGTLTRAVYNNGHFYCDEDVGLVIRNHDAVDRRVYYGGYKLERIVRTGSVRYGLPLVVGDGYVEVTPALGEYWVITSVGMRGDGTYYGVAYIMGDGEWVKPVCDLALGLGEGDANLQAESRVRDVLDSGNQLRLTNHDPVDRYLHYLAVQVRRGWGA